MPSDANVSNISFESVITSLSSFSVCLRAFFVMVIMGFCASLIRVLPLDDIALWNIMRNSWKSLTSSSRIKPWFSRASSVPHSVRNIMPVPCKIDINISSVNKGYCWLSKSILAIKLSPSFFKTSLIELSVIFDETDMSDLPYVSTIYFPEYSIFVNTTASLVFMGSFFTCIRILSPWQTFLVFFLFVKNTLSLFSWYSSKER